MTFHSRKSNTPQGHFNSNRAIRSLNSSNATDNEIVATFPTSTNGALVATIGEFRGRRVVNVRKFYRVDGEMMASSKGIAVDVERLPGLVEVAEKALAVARERGLLPAA